MVVAVDEKAAGRFMIRSRTDGEAPSEDEQQLCLGSISEPEQRRRD